MIELIERKSKKIPSITSIFFKMNFYDANTFATIIQMQEVVYDKPNNTFEIPINKLYFMVQLLRKFDDVKFTPYKEKAVEQESVAKYKFKVKPFQHQREAVEYGLTHKNWLLLDSMGLGKTGTIIYLADVLRKKEGLKHCLIVCGVNSLKYNWVDEIHKFSDLDCCVLGTKVSSKGNESIVSVPKRVEMLKKGIKEFFVITNIETLRDKGFADAFNNSKSKFDMIVIDEGHKVKEPTTLSAKTLMKLKADRKIVLSGTLIVNNPENAYVSLKWTNNINCNYSQFKSMYNVYGGFGGKQVIGHKNLNLLQDLLSTCSLRRLKEDVIDLPPKLYKTEYVEMGAEQGALYNEVENKVLEELDLLDHKPSIIEELGINLRLRQITAFPGIVSTATNKSAKLDRCEELVEEIVAQGDKVVIFNTFKASAYELAERLKKYNCVVCTGDFSDDDISAKVKQFQQDDNIKVFIGTWQKCGTGITLTSANYLIFIDTPWTFSDFSQASDRIYRIGQKKSVQIITLMTKNTYDERVQEIIDRKECLSNYLVDKKESENLRNIE